MPDVHFLSLGFDQTLARLVPRLPSPKQAAVAMTLLTCLSVGALVDVAHTPLPPPQGAGLGQSPPPPAGAYAWPPQPAALGPTLAELSDLHGDPATVYFRADDEAPLPMAQPVLVCPGISLTSSTALQFEITNHAYREGMMGPDDCIIGTSRILLIGIHANV